MKGNSCKMVSLCNVLENSTILLPLFSGVQAGFPSPASDFLDAEFDLAKFLIPRPSSTYFMRISGDSMIDAGIMDNALIIVDKSIKPAHDQIFVCCINGEFTVKRLKMENGRYVLYPENSKYKPIVPDDESDFIVWGAVTYAINPTLNRRA